MPTENPLLPRLVLSLDGVVLRELPISKERTTIGRRSHNDLVIDNLAVSGEHAVIISQANDTFLEDLGSTNGTMVNGQPVKKHRLQDGDVVELGKYLLRYSRHGLNLEQGSIDIETSPGSESTLYNPTPDTIQVRSPALGGDHGLPPAGVSLIRILTGPNVGKEMPLVKTLTTVGRPGRQVAVITRRPTGFFLAQVEGDTFPLINGMDIGASAKVLRHGDVIELAGIKMEFATGNT